MTLENHYMQDQEPQNFQILCIEQPHLKELSAVR